MQQSVPTLLITQQELSQYGGSEVVVLELSELAINIGFKVHILTNYYGLPISNDFSEQVTIIGPDEDLNIEEYSHVWIHHNFIPNQLIDMIGRVQKKSLPKIAFHHMSPFVPIEAPLFPRFEANIATCIYFNSEETRDVYKNYLPFDKITILGNPSPDSFFKPSREIRKNVQRVLVVSNHPPKEVLEALKGIDGLEWELFGADGHVGRVTEKILDQYDAVVAIGKTVQYCIASQIPVYCYDHFGGPGYITDDNFDKARYHNFSGRGFKQKEPSEISNEIISGFWEAQQQIKQIHKKYSKEFRLSSQLISFFDQKNLNHIFDAVDDIDLYQIRHVVKSNSDLVRSVVHYKYLYNAEKELVVNIRDIEDKLHKSLDHNKDLESQLTYLRQSIWKRMSSKLRNYVRKS